MSPAHAGLIGCISRCVGTLILATLELQAVDYLHSQKIVHGDLKPENILVSASGAVTGLDRHSGTCASYADGVGSAAPRV